MMILDFNQIAISNLMMNINGMNIKMDINIMRHMILNTIRSNRQKFHAEYGELVIACDDKNYWRKEYFPYYKASRKKSRDRSNLDWNEIFSILNTIREEIKEFMPYPTIQVEHAEADDIIGSLCAKYGRVLGGEPILILSADKDFIQLQKYANVKQYDPIRKRWIKHDKPEYYLVEHILRGDSGDGIPNFLSVDDTFVSDARQKPLRTKLLNEIMEADDPTSIMNEDQKRNYFRNKKLIDLDNVPEDIRGQVLNQYDSQQDKTRKHLFNYFIKHKLKNLHEHIGEF